MNTTAIIVIIVFTIAINISIFTIMTHDNGHDQFPSYRRKARKP